MRLSLATLLVAAVSAANTQDYVIRDVHGRRTGTVERASTDKYVVRDNGGRRLNTTEEDVGKRLVNREQRRMGTIERGPSKDLVVRDTGRRRLETIRSQPGGSFVIRTASGRRTGTVTRRWRTTWGARDHRLYPLFLRPVPAPGLAGRGRRPGKRDPISPFVELLWERGSKFERETILKRPSDPSLYRAICT